MNSRNRDNASPRNQRDASHGWGIRLTDVAARNFRRAIQTLTFSEVAALSLFGLAVLVATILQSIPEWSLAGIFILFTMLLFFFRMTATRIRLAEIENEKILLRLREAERIPQPSLPGLEPGGRRRRERKRGQH